MLPGDPIEAPKAEKVLVSTEKGAHVGLQRIPGGRPGGPNEPSGGPMGLPGHPLEASGGLHELP